MQRDTFFSFSLFAKRYDPFIVSTTMIRYMQAGYYGPTVHLWSFEFNEWTKI